MTTPPPMQNDNRKWCVTAINRITRQRQIVTPACSLQNATAIRNRTLETPPGKRSYTYPVVREYSWYLDHAPVQTNINFKE